MNEWRKLYGDVYGYFFGDAPVMAIHDPEILRKCFIQHSRTFCERPPSALLVEPFMSCVLFLHGNEFRKIRQTLELGFTDAKLKHIYPKITGIVDHLLRNIEHSAVENRRLEILFPLKELTLNTIAGTMLAVDFRIKQQSLVFNAVYNLLKEVEGSSVDYLLSIPFVRTLAKFVFPYSKAGKSAQVLLDYLKQVIQMKQKGDLPKTPDILQSMINFQEDETSDFSEQHTLSNAFIMLLAGYETTSLSLGYSVHLLAQHQDIQHKIYMEVSSHFSEDGQRSFESLQQLKYLDMFIKEVLRLYPPVLSMISRHCEEDVTVDDHFFPKGCSIQVPVWYLHRDPEFWTKPDEFDPERFSEENGKSISPFVYMPFGIGHRRCLGMKFALLEMKLALAKLLKQYRIVEDVGSEGRLELHAPNYVLYPKNDVFVRLERR